jgi:PIN domain nuclease of toxin-antitoxin system
MLLLDTCTLVFDALAPRKLSRAAATALDREEQQGGLACADISLWEIAMLVQRGRLSPGVGTREFIDLALAHRSVRVLPINPAIAARCAAIDLNSDPADLIIAATALEYRATLVTADRRLRRSKTVPVVAPTLH